MQDESLHKRQNNSRNLVLFGTKNIQTIKERATAPFIL